MKKVLSLLFVASLMTTACSRKSQGADDLTASRTAEDNPNGGGGSNTTAVPSAVLTTFNTRYPDATNVQWKLLSNSNYKAEFYRGSVKWQAIFTPDGTLLKEEYK